jgi:hypothetical protein
VCQAFKALGLMKNHPKIENQCPKKLSKTAQADQVGTGNNEFSGI